ncbi:MAG: undecaprenyldiphospho-muramoylpentapeptide beta-N-acetylglucosaminyltransferase [Chloroherpetonaceae bacterium]|nr:undecaprenyldiphospho-muramoylpentapeptide beta-N-acetylglucosaminyltransferase [Chloroherpetonaceae bacterium]MDW8437639.1 undecaprenyldiphospho-muramoylpentapeptide beta-N-acetylglucosaminyltransferase [Chloroherpetonaceae bacterium]
MKALFAGGGTGGHFFPAVAIAEEILRQKPDAQVAFAGTERGIEATEAPKRNFTLHFVSAVAFKRGFSPQALFENLKFPFRLLESVSDARELLDQEEPDVVVGTGGFVSFPVVWAAQEFGVPTLLQEQNSKPGWATRVLATRADEVHLSFEDSRRFFSKRVQCFVTGNPTRRFERVLPETARQFFNLDPKRKTLLVFGGSLGARSLNGAVEKWLDELLTRANVIWQTGKTDYDNIASRVQPRENLWRNAFIDRMDLAYSAADLALCRAGASTIAELTNVGVAAVLVPYPFAADNHQYFNAKALADKGAAELVLDDAIASRASFEKIVSLLEDDQRREAMRERAKRLGKPDAAKVIAERVIRLAESN